MHSFGFRFRHEIGLLVCLLVVGVVSLADAAKRSQYQHRPGLSTHFTQENKISDDGAQRSADFAFIEPAVFSPPEPLVFCRIAAPPAAPTRRAIYRDAFRLRPPPPPRA